MSGSSDAKSSDLVPQGTDDNSSPVTPCDSLYVSSQTAIGAGLPPYHSSAAYREISSDNDTDDQDVTEKLSSATFSSKESSPEFDSNDSPPGIVTDDDTIPLLVASGVSSRPGNLILPRPITIERGDDAIANMLTKPLEEQGTVSQEGEMIAFVADDLTDLIRLSSPPTRSIASM